MKLIAKLIITMLIIGVGSFNKAIATPPLAIAAAPLKIGIPKTTQGEAPEQKQLFSFLIDYWTHWAEAHDYNIEFQYGSYKELQEAVIEHRVDILVIHKAKHRDALASSIPYINLSGTIYERIKKIEEGKIALNMPSNFGPSYFDRYNEVVFHSPSLGNFTPALETVNYIYTLYPDKVRAWLDSVGIAAKFSLSTQKDNGVKFSAAVALDRPTLLDQINRSFVHGDLKTETARWKKAFPGENSAYRLLIGTYLKSLSEQHLRVISSLSILTFSYTKKGAEPGFIANQFFLDGYLINTLRKISDVTGIHFKPVEYSSFKESLEAVRLKEVDLYPGLFKTDKRNFLTFTNPIGRYISAVASQDGLSSLVDLENKKLTQIKGFAYNDNISNLVGAVGDHYETLEYAIEAVSKGQGDAFIGDLFELSYYISKDNFQNLTVLRTEDFNFDLPYRIGLQKKYQDILDIFNLAIFSFDGDLQAESQATWSKEIRTLKVNNKLQKITDKYIYYSFSMFCVFFIIFLIFRHNLKKKIVLTKALENALNIAEKQKVNAESLATAKSDFLAKMSHEIRTPMNGVLGMAEALTYTTLNQEQKQLLNTLNSSALGLLGLLNDVLDFSKMEANMLTIEEINTDLKVEVKQVYNNFLLAASEKKIDLILNIEPDLFPRYLCDGTRLTQVLNNMVSNAIKFTETGSVTIEVKLIQRDDNVDTLGFYVTDTGIGIPSELLPNLFTPFTQAEGSTTRKYGGTGLGLSICKEIVEAMGGEIRVASITGKGSQFKASILLKHVNADSISTEDRSSKVKNHHHDLSLIRVLFVEDNPLNHYVISIQLRRLGVAFDYVKNGQDALNSIEKNHYDIVLSDCHMPVMTGYELARRLSKFENRPYLIALTADVLNGSIEKCLQAGFDSYVSKPCPIDVLDKALKQAMSAIDLSTNKPYEHHGGPSPIIDNHDGAQPLVNLQSDNEPLTDNAKSSSHSAELNNETFSPEHILSICGGDQAMAITILSTFLGNWKNEAEDYRNVDLSKPALKDAFHKLKGSFLYLGSNDLAQQAEEMELSAFDYDVSYLQDKLYQLTLALSNIAEDIQRYVDHGQ